MGNQEVDKDTYKKIEVECSVCKSKFEIWVATSHYNSEMEKNIRENFYRYCPVCKVWELMKNQEK